MVNLHGGGYIFGHGESGTNEAMLMAAFGGYKVLAIDYRMPPDAPYPAGMDDATAAWRALVATMDPRCVAVEGTSAGGGMTLSLRLRAKAEALPLPGAIAPGSPPADLTNTGDSRKTNEWLDSVLVSIDAPYPRSVAQLYAHGHDLEDPATIAHLRRLPRHAARPSLRPARATCFCQTRCGCIASCAGPASSRSCRSTRVCRTRNTCSTRR